MTSPGDAGGPGSGLRNALTFDLEHWHSATLVRDAVDEPEDRIVDSTTIVLDVLDRYDVEATFFVVGAVAAEYPELIARIADDGHELASHGHTHTPLDALTEAEFEQEVSASARAIRRAADVDPVGFRAPNFSVTGDTAWALRVLESAGYRYDSSVFPVRTPMYGVPGVPVHPYEIRLDDPFREHAGTGCGLVECPVSAVGTRLRVPIAGGFYARVLPTWILKRGIRALNSRGVPATLYFHPWEFNPAVRTEAPPVHRRFVSFYGLERTATKLAQLLDSFDWAPLCTVLDAREPGATARGTATDTERSVKTTRESDSRLRTLQNED